MVIMKDYEDKDGNVDWNAYQKAQIAAGERCSQCHAFIMFPKDRPGLCGSCNDLTQDVGEVRHSTYIRCPHCQALMDVADSEQHDLWEEGEHDMICSSCDKEFIVKTNISYSFESPEIVEENNHSDV